MLITTPLLLASVALALPHQQPLQQTHRETEDEAGKYPQAQLTSVQHIAELLHTVRTGVLASVYPSGDLAGFPMAMMESHAPCHPEGSLTFISMPISLMQRNIKGTDGKASYAIGTVLPPGSHGEYAKPRASLTGNFTVLEDVGVHEHARLSQCFVRHHPEARWWLPGNAGVHTSHWAKFDVQDVYYVGGFGNVGHIGHLPLDKYAEAMDHYSDHKNKN